MGRVYKNKYFSVLFIILLFASTPCVSGNAKHQNDPHYTDVGFFDVHFCSWPDRPPFYLALYSTIHYDNVESIKIIDPNDRVIGELNLDKYRIIKRKNKADKHVFITQIPAPEIEKDGWFKASVKLKDGKSDVASDFVIHQLLPQAKELQPGSNAENVTLPKYLNWEKIDGAAYYQVYIRDLWDGEKLIYTSILLDNNTIKLPNDLLQPGGYYSWRVHARDMNGHIQLGDFNIGSLSKRARFSVNDE